MTQAVTGEFGPIAGRAFNVASHAGVGCLSSVASGGSCKSGALSGGISAAADPVLPHDLIGGTVGHAIVGGLASVAGGGKFENGAVTGAFGYLFNSMWHSHTAVPFVDDQGNSVLAANGMPMQRPSDVDPHFFVDAGAAAGAADATPDALNMESRAELLKLVQGGPWDAQRVGSDRTPTQAFINFATVAIGLYGAAAAIPEREILTYENSYAGAKSQFAPNTVYDTTYTHLPANNVFNTNLGYQLYQSGRIGPSP